MTAASEQPGAGLRSAWAIARRDLVEFVRDRRTLFITLLLPMVTYPILALSTALGVRTASNEIEADRAPVDIRVAVSGVDAEALVERLRDLDRRVRDDTPKDWPRSLDFAVVGVEQGRPLLERGEVDLWIEAPRGSMAGFDAVGTVKLPVHSPPGRTVNRRVREQFDAVARRLAEEARSRRIERAGLPASVLTPLVLEFPDERERPRPAPPRSIMATLAGGVLVLLAVLTLTGAFYPAIDAIAGEKERGTIETLLIAPCSSRDIVFGKFLAVFAVTLATLAANAVSIAATATVTRRFLPDGLTMALPEGAVGAVAMTTLAFVGLAALSAATCLAVTTAAKSGKEAQNTLTPVILLVSALAGTALLPGMRSDSLLAATPFSGQVLVARAALAGGVAGPDRGLAAVWPLAVTILSAVFFTWLLLRATAALLTDEDILFRGGDVAAGGFARPAPRPRPNVVQGMFPILTGLAALWYLQGFAIDDLVQAIPLQQIMALVVPLAVITWWQRVDVRRTFGLAWPGGAGHPGRVIGWLVGAALVGIGTFAVGAAAFLAVKGTDVSAEARILSEKLMHLMQSQPLWVAWSLMAVMPAVCEELLFRGWVQTAFLGKARSGQRVAAAIVAQAALFAIFHLLPERMPQTFLVGLVLGWLTYASGSLLPALIGHVAHNSMPLILLESGLPDWAWPAAMGCLLVGAALVAGCLAAGRTDREEAT